MVRPILSALTLVVALGAPVLVPAVALAGEQPGVSIRVYDRTHKDYHPWSGEEDRAAVARPLRAGNEVRRPC